MKKRLVLLAAGIFVVNLGTAHALVMTNGDPAQKFRKDVGKQLSKHLLCLIKALQKCEATAPIPAASAGRAWGSTSSGGSSSSLAGR